MPERAAKHRRNTIQKRAPGRVDADEPLAPMPGAQRPKRVFRIDIENCLSAGCQTETHRVGAEQMHPANARLFWLADIEQWKSALSLIDSMCRDIRKPCLAAYQAAPGS